MFQTRARWAHAFVGACVAIASAPQPTAAATLPLGFSEAAVVPTGSLSSPTAMQIAPDGRIFVCQQTGALRVIKNGVLLSTPFVSVSVDANGERGLLGVAFDPNFAVNQYVYVYYTVPGAGAVTVHNRVSRLTANGDVAVGGSEVVLVDLDNLSGATNHNGGAIDFGPDGKLYIAVGDNANGANAQSMSTRHGKMLRLNADGSIPTDNPFHGTASGLNRAIWALGLRNPFTFAQNPGGPAPTMVINDVGQSAWEEVNPGASGANYGWPTTEGDFNPATPANAGFTRPRYAYPHAGGTTNGCAITGGAFYNPVTVAFPAAYQHVYFFADYCGGWIKYIDAAQAFPYPTLATPTNFASGISSPVDLKVGADGSLYYLARGSGTVFRVQYGDVAPGITSHPADRIVLPGQPASFTVSASGTGPLSYRWQRNRVDIPGAAGAAITYTLTSAQLGDSGARFRVNVSNAVNNVFSNEATLTVTTNLPPVATITAPTASLLYTGGMTVTFAGTGIDPDGTPTTLLPSAFTWWVDFHHDTHTHPFLPATTGVTGGTFTIPTTGETSGSVWYRLHLTVTDAVGLMHSVQRDVFPRKVRLTLATSPGGLQVRLDGQPVTAPLTFDSVVGMVRTIDAPPQTSSGTAYAFAAWSDAGAPGRAIVTPSANATYTATFQAVSVSATPPAPTNLASVVNGATLRLSWNRAPGAQSYRLESGTASGLANLFNGDVGDVSSLEGLVPPGTYFVRVRAANAAGVSAASTQVTVVVASAASCATPPPAPAGYTAQVGGLLLALAWPASPGATSYFVEAGLSSGATSVPPTNLGNVTTYQGTAPPGTYFTRVRAANACGVSVPSPEVEVTMGCSAAPVVPAGLIVTKAAGVATFAWQPPLGATGYRMQVGSAPGASSLADVAIGAATTVPVSLVGVPPGTYYVRVIAVSACGAGAPSNEVAVGVP